MGYDYEEDYSEQLGMASIGCSDDHFNLVMGTTVTGFNSNEHKTLISAVKARATRAIKVDGSLDPIISVARIFFLKQSPSFGAFHQGNPNELHDL